MESIKLANIDVEAYNKQYLIELFNKNDGFNQLTTVNAEFIVLAHKDEKFREIINNSTSTIDGQWPCLFARFKNSGKKIEKISGADLIYDIVEIAEKKALKIFILGDTAYVNAETVKILRENYKVNIEGYSPPFQNYPFDHKTNEFILEEIRKQGPHFLLVGFGAPKQEYWISDNREALEDIGVNWAMGLGGTFRFISNAEKRAPKWISSIGMEGIWRLAQNPKRLNRFIKSVEFFKYI
jgi:N-acetylglucosaminyldiphosphoundecaprenol N-acetyl-beta-D-mannosaminyltransferase